MQQVINILVLGSIYGLFSMGLSLAWGVANILNLAHGAVFVTGATVTYVIGTVTGLPLIVLLPVAMLVGALITVVMDAVAFTPIIAKSETLFNRELAFLMATFGFNGILINVTEELTESRIVSIPQSVFQSEVFRFGDVSITNIQILTLVFGIIVAVALTWWIKRTRQGRLRAVAYNDRITPLFGIDGKRLSRATLAVSGALAAGAGVLLAILLSGFNAHSGESLMIKAFAVIIVGGIGNVMGTALAAYGLAAVETVAFLTLGGEAQDAAAFVIILIVLLLRPQGVLGATTTERA
ncbi:branched-chain amino acid ABC transporter permease [Microbacterium sp.]|uniref:branched-chain amino acid ABC transporter permease n=1 Tax=Microbacterium sp. TaxID=51671 RepID=UPI0039E44142